MDYTINDSDPIFYIFYSLNKTILNENDLQILRRLGYCNQCLIKLSKKELKKNEVKYIENKDWDKFLLSFPMRLNECNCTRCNCGLNKNIDVIYDLFDYEDKYPICKLICQKCNNQELKIPVVPKYEFKKNKRIRLEDENSKHNIINNNINNNINEILC